MDGVGGCPFLFTESVRGFTRGEELPRLSAGAGGFRGRQGTLEPRVVSDRTWTLFWNATLPGRGVLCGSVTCSDGAKLEPPPCPPGLQVNVLALSICTREAYQSMKEREVDDGHIININR